MRRRGEEQATDIKSNNPHLAGGEKHIWICSASMVNHYHPSNFSKFVTTMDFQSLNPATTPSSSSSSSSSSTILSRQKFGFPAVDVKLPESIEQPS